MQNNNLTDFIDEVCSDSHLRVEADLGDGFVRLRTDEAERRQAVQDIRSVEDAVIELLRNSRDAGARNIYVASSRYGNHRTVTVLDDGCGVPPALHKTIFEPRVTSKLDSVHLDKWGIHGRGMALYSIKVNSEEARVMRSSQGAGTSLKTRFDANRLQEKKDQSSFPQFSLSEESKIVIRGPHNILRVATEFALEHRSDINVYLGTPSEIAATLYFNTCAQLTQAERAFAVIDESVPATSVLGFALTPETFAEQATSLGLELSDRTARRILDGSIKPIASLEETVKYLLLQQGDQTENEHGASKSPSHHKRTAPKHHESTAISAKDLELLADGALSAYQELADAYYLSGDVSPEVKIRDGKIIIALPIVQSEDI